MMMMMMMTFIRVEHAAAEVPQAGAESASTSKHFWCTEERRAVRPRIWLLRFFLRLLPMLLLWMIAAKSG